MPTIRHALSTLLGCLAVVLVAGCGGSPTGDDATSARAEVLPGATSSGSPARRASSAELPGDDPAFQAALDAFDGYALERRVLDLTGLRSDDLGGGYFGQRFYMSLWSPVPDEVALSVCHELVDHANEIAFPATEIAVKATSYADLEWSQDLVVVDASGECAGA